MRKEKITNNNNDVASVKLKPVLGVNPRVYLGVIYSLLLLALLFLFFVLPGIKNDGTKVTVNTSPGKALVFVDDKYKGTTPATFFVPKGVHSFTIKKEYFKTITIKKSIDGRILFSLVFPKRLKITKDMVMVDSVGFLKRRFKLISGYSLIKDFYDRYQYPPLITETVREYMNSSRENDLKYLYDFLYSMRYNFGSKEIVKDLASSIRLLDDNLARQSSDYLVIESFYKKHGFDIKTLPYAYLCAFPEKERLDILKELNISENDLYPRKAVHPPEIKNGINFLSFDGFKFIKIDPASYTAGFDKPDINKASLNDSFFNSFPHIEKVDSMFILDREVTVGQFKTFLKENPKWERDNIVALMGKSLVTEDYLANFSSLDNDIPVSYVSWFAADAFCNWLTSRLPESLKGEFYVRLPKEGEWELAARMNGSSKNAIFKGDYSGPKGFSSNRTGALGISDMFGNLWEWSDNYYFPSDSVNGSFGISLGETGIIFNGVEKSVRGGSWANDSVSVFTRGSQEPSWCTPFLGFRPVVVKRK